MLKDFLNFFLSSKRNEIKQTGASWTSYKENKSKKVEEKNLA